VEDNTQPIDHQPNTPESQDKENARTAYLGYAALANLSNESIEQGLGLVEIANETQTERIQAAFASVAKVLMEVKGLVEMPLAIELSPQYTIKTDIIGYRADSLQQTLPWAGRRYLANIVGDIDDIDLHLEHVPALVELLVEMRGTPERVDRHALDIRQLLTLRFAGLTAAEIAIQIDSSASRVKGNFYRFSEAIERQSTAEDRNSMLRSRLEEKNLLIEKHVLSKEELDAKLPPRAAKNTSTGRAGRASKKTTLTSAVQEENLAIDFVPHKLPADLLPGETMGERRVRLREAAKENT